MADYRPRPVTPPGRLIPQANMPAGARRVPAHYNACDAPEPDHLLEARMMAKADTSNEGGSAVLFPAIPVKTTPRRKR